MNEDETLMQEVSEGNRNAYDLLARKWFPRISLHCFRMISNKHTAEDLAQEVLIKLWRFRQSFSGRSKFSTYIWRITCNTCIDYARAERERTVELAEDLQDKNPFPEEILHREEEISQIEKAISSLTKSQRSVMILRHYEGLKFREIAEVLDVPIGTVHSRMAEAMLRIQKFIERNYS